MEERQERVTGTSASCGTSGGVRSQFGHPRGILGWLVGHVMAINNRSRGAWVREQLDAQPGDRVLEVGCGPGVDLAAVAARTAYAAGVDVSAEMVRQAGARCAAAVAAGRVAIVRASATALPFPDATFDRAFSINSVQFWEDRALALHELRRVLRPGGVLAVAIQPRNPGADAATTRAWQSKLEAALAAAGFEGVSSKLDERPRIPVVCVVGRRPW
jgi:SAM-dependent methyltransferase